MISARWNSPAFSNFIQRFVRASENEIDNIARRSADRVRNSIVEKTAIDTGALLRSWSGPSRHGPFDYRVSTTVEYAVTLEYGRYEVEGPRTVALGGSVLGAGYVAGPGIYSTQSPYGMVRRALAEESPVYIKRLQDMLRRAWGS